MAQRYTKDQVRETYLKKRDKLSESVRAKRSSELCHQILDSVDPEWSTIGLYESFGSEVCLDELAYILHKKGYTVAFPRCLDRGYMDFYCACIPVPLPGKSLAANDAEMRTHRNDEVAMPDGFFDGTFHREYDPFLPQLTHPARTVSAEELNDCIRVDPSELDMIVLPGIAFTKDGERLGYGGGYYDRYLPRAREECIRWAACFREQIRGSLPLEECDQPLDQVFIV